MRDASRAAEASPVLSAYPGGRHTITRDDNERLCRYVDAPGLPPGEAHPMFAHIITIRSKGVTFEGFAAALQAAPDSGLLFGGGSLEYLQPLRVDTPYLIRGRITSVEPRTGRRTGRFDLATSELEIVDEATGAVAVRSTETTIVPRRSGT